MSTKCLLCARSLGGSTAVGLAPASKRSRAVKIKHESDFQYDDGYLQGNPLSSQSYTDAAEREVWTIFLVRKILLLPENTCENLLKTKGNPTEWNLKCCDQCNDFLIMKTEKVYQQLSKLNAKLFELKKSIRNTLLSSFTKKSAKQSQDTDEEWRNLRVLMADNIKKVKRSKRQKKSLGKPIPQKTNMKFTGKTPCKVIVEDVPVSLTTTPDAVVDKWNEIFSKDHFGEGQSIEIEFRDATNETGLDDIGNDNDYDENDNENDVDYENSNSSGDEYSAGKDKNEDQNGEYYCHSCNEMFSVKSQFNYHVSFCPVMIRSSSLIKCPDCPRIFISEQSLTKHAQKKDHVDLADNTIYCNHCFKTFLNKFSKKRHMHTCYVRAKLYPDDFAKDFAAYKKAMERRQVSKRTFKCSFCDLAVATAFSKKRHESKCTKKPADYVPPDTTSVNRRYTLDNACKVCGEKFDSRTRVLYHIKTAHQPRSTCAQCGKQVVNMANHLRTHDEVKAYLCELCSRTFSNHQNLKYHYKSHHANELNIPRAVCEYCNKDFPDKYYLQKHIRCLHTKDYDYVCPDCGLGFTQKSNFELHCKIHAGVKLPCSNCNKTFSNSFSLQRHMRVHTGEYPYKCRFCDKRFRCSGDRRIHEDIHGNEYRHKCKICGQRFLLRNQLKSHLNKGEHNPNLAPDEQCVPPESLKRKKRSKGVGEESEVTEDATVVSVREHDILSDSLLHVGPAVQVEIDSVVGGVLTSGQYEGQTFQLHYYPGPSTNEDEGRQAVANIQVGAIEEIPHIESSGHLQSL